jgi:hypothetical protein
MKLPPLMKALLAIPLILVDAGLFLVACYLIAVAIAGGTLAFPTLWWVAPLSVISALSFVAASIVVGTRTINHLHDLLDPQKVLACSFQGLGVNLLGVILGILLITMLVLSEFFLTPTR